MPDRTGARMEATTGASADGDREVDADRPAESGAGEGHEFGRRGWTLVAMIVFAFVVAPTLIVLYPPNRVPFFVAYLVLPLGVAVILGVVAVWAAIR